MNGIQICKKPKFHEYAKAQKANKHIPWKHTTLNYIITTHLQVDTIKMKNHLTFPQEIQIKFVDKQNNTTHEQHENNTLLTQQMKFNEQVEK